MEAPPVATKRKVLVRRKPAAANPPSGVEAEGGGATTAAVPVEEGEEALALAPLAVPRLAEYEVLGDVAEYEEALGAELKAAASPPHSPPKPTPATTLRPELAATLELAPHTAEQAFTDALQRKADEREELAAQLATLRASRLGTAQSGVSGVQGWELHEKMTYGRTERMLRNWEAHMLEWDVLKQRLVEASGKAPSELAMERADLHRRKVEEMENLHVAVPLKERHGSDQWTMSLRDNWTRYVPVGNIFSGLFCPVEDAPNKNLMQVRRPMGTSASAKGFTGTRTWMESKYLLRRKAHYKQQLAEVLPNAGELEALEVVGRSIEAELDGLLAKDVSAEELEDHVATTHADTWAAIQYGRAQAAAAAEEAAAAEAAAAAAAAAAVQGPVMELRGSRVSVNCAKGGSASGSIEIANTGSTALFYTWARCERTLLPSATGGGDAQRFYLADQAGVLLPGEVKTVTWVFKSADAGLFTEKWQVSTRPELKEAVGPVALRGVAVDEDTQQLARKQLEAELAYREKMHKVKLAIDSMVDGVPEPKPPAAPLPEGADAVAFTSTNADAEPAVYYSPEAYGALAAVYDEAQALLNPPPPMGREPPPSPPPAGSVAGAAAAAASVAEVDAAAAEALGARVAAAAEAARVPPNAGALRVHAMHAALVSLADGVEEAAAQAKAETAPAPPEEAGEAAEEGAEGAEAEAPPPPAAPPAEEDGEEATGPEPPSEEYLAALQGKLAEALGAAADAFEAGAEAEAEAVYALLSERAAAATEGGDHWGAFAELRTKAALEAGLAA